MSIRVYIRASMCMHACTFCVPARVCPSVCLCVVSKSRRKASASGRAPSAWSERPAVLRRGSRPAAVPASQRRHVLDLPRNAAPRKGTVTSAWRPRPSGRPAPSSLPPPSPSSVFVAFSFLLAPPHLTASSHFSFTFFITSSLSVSRFLKPIQSHHSRGGKR